MRADLRSFFERATVVELLLAFVFATVVVSFVSAVVNGVLISPLQQSSRDESTSFSSLDASIGGRLFQFTYIVAYGVVLLIAAAGAAWLLRLSDDQLWDPGASRSCPHCLSEIPLEAGVCSYCTRDVPPATSAG